MGEIMSTSKQEEIISALWAICAILCFSHGYTIWGYIFVVKSTLDTIFSIVDTEYMISKTETKLGAIITYTPTNPNA